LDSRQDGRKIPGCLIESARPSLFLALVFFVFGSPIEMVMTRPSHSPFVIVILCLCLCSLFFAPLFGVLGTAEFDSDQIETEEDLLFDFGGHAAFMDALTSGLELTRLDVHPASLSPAFLPPKHSFN